MIFGIFQILLGASLRPNGARDRHARSGADAGLSPGQAMTLGTAIPAAAFYLVLAAAAIWLGVGSIGAATGPGP